jgi:hypothetical protein
MGWFDKLYAWLFEHDERLVREPIDCRCGQHKTLYEAAREAQIFNAPYMHKMG